MELLPSPVRDRHKAMRNRVREIARAARGRGDAARARREKSYRSLLRIVRPVVTATEKANPQARRPARAAPPGLR